MWFIYIIECIDKKLYTGITVNVDERLKAHKLGKGAKFTKSKGPFKLLYVEKALTRSLATKKEIQIKKLKKEEKLKLIKNKV